MPHCAVCEPLFSNGFAKLRCPPTLSLPTETVALKNWARRALKLGSFSRGTRPGWKAHTDGPHATRTNVAWTTAVAMSQQCPGLLGFHLKTKSPLCAKRVQRRDPLPHKNCTSRGLPRLCPNVSKQKIKPLDLPHWDHKMQIFSL